MMTVRLVSVNFQGNQLKIYLHFLGFYNENIMSCSPVKVTPADYQPPGFKEGECDSLWFEGTAVHFKLGEVQTAFHSLRVRVSAEKSWLEKLQKGNHLGETKQLPQINPPEQKTNKVGSEGLSI